MSEGLTLKKEPILLRKCRLKSITNGKHLRETSIVDAEKNASTSVDLNEECLMDALIFLYDECRLSYDKESRHVKFFINKFGSVVNEVKQMRVNIADFKLGDVIGRGQFAEVKAVKEKANNRVYALKTINKFEDQVQKYLPLIDAELAILSKNASQWLVELKYAFQDCKRLYFVLEYLPGGDFKSLLRRSGGKLPEDSARFVLAELVLAVNAVHSLGFAHRDIKPENILFDRMGHLKLIDFGSASRIRTGKVTTAFPVVNPSYVAPEVLKNLEDDQEKKSQLVYGTECDYWSLGVVAYESVFGVTPFEGGSFLATFNNILAFAISLKFPEAVVVSKDMRDLIVGLLSDQGKRLLYNDCLRHCFFNSVIWDGIRSELSPCIPKVETEDDTSNFKSCHKSSMFAIGPEKSAQNIPFVGFTRTLMDFKLNRNLNNSYSFLESSNNSYVLEDKYNKDDTNIKLKGELTAKDVALEDRLEEIRSLESRLTESNDIVNSKDSEIAKLIGDVKRLQIEKAQVDRSLMEEREIRKEVESKSTSLVTGIKSSLQKKVNELNSDLKLHKELMSEKDKCILDLEMTVENLRLKLKTVQDEVNSTHGEETKVHQNLAKSFRGSISVIESRLMRNSSDFEAQIQEMKVKHRDELKMKEKAFETQLLELTGLLEQKIQENGTLAGRLDESRNSREILLEEMRQQRKHYDETITVLEETIESMQENYNMLQKEKDQSEVMKVETLEDELEKTRSEKLDISCLLDLEKKENEVRQGKIDEMAQLLVRFEGHLSILEVQNKNLFMATNERLQKCEDLGVEKGSISVLQDQLEKYKTSLDACKFDLIGEKQKVEKYEKDLLNLQKELGNAKVDIRILTREKKELEDKFTKHETGLSEAAAKLSLLEAESVVFGKKNVECEKQIVVLLAKSQEDSYELGHIKKILQESKLEQQRLEKDLSTANAEIGDCKTKLNEFEKLTIAINEREDILKEKNLILDERNRKIETLNGSVEMLKEACNVIENQLKDFETLVSRKVQELVKAGAVKSQLELDYASLNDQLKKTRIELNEAISLKIFAEKKLNDAESYRQSEESANNFLKGQLSELKKRNEELVEELDKSHALMEEIKATKEHFCTIVEKFKVENTLLKTELSRTITSLVTLKDHNIQLKASLQQAVHKAEIHKSRADVLNEDRILAEIDYVDRETQLQSTISQQMKLIEYLRSQNDNLSKKKKFRFFGRDKGEKENTPIPFDVQMPIFNSTPRQGQKIRTYEAAKVSNFQSKLDKEIPITPRKDDHNDIRPTKEISVVSQRNPHCFSEKLNLQVAKCWKCFEPIYFGRQFSVCKSCPAVYHIRCGISAQNCCGLSKELAHEIEKNALTIESDFATDDEEEEETVEGWVKLAKGNCWVSRYARLQEGRLCFYKDQSNVPEPLETFPLNEKTTVELRVNPKSIDNEAVKALTSKECAFAVKIVTPQMGNKGMWIEDDSIFLLSSSSRQKRYWTRVIMNHAPHISVANVGGEDVDDTESRKSTDPCIQKSTIFIQEASDHLSVNCVKYVTGDLYLMGSEEGLFSRKIIENSPDVKVKIDGIGSIYQIEFHPKLSSAIMIEGKERQLVLVHLGLLRACAEAASCSKPKLEVQPVEGIQNCLMFQIQSMESNEVFLAVATHGYLHILFWDKDTFKIRKNIHTPEAVSCILTTPHSIIFGCLKLYEVDVKNFQMDEFIDESDETLFYVMSSSSELDGIPMASLDVSMSNLSPGQTNYFREYLLCFTDMAVFVDGYGRRSRSEDIVWSKVPLAVSYNHPNLYVLHFSSVEIIVIGSTSYTKMREPCSKDTLGKEFPIIPESRFVHLSNPRLCGNGKKTSSIVVGSMEESKIEILEICAEKSDHGSTIPFETSFSSGELNVPVTTDTSRQSFSSNTFSDLSSVSTSDQISDTRYNLHKN